MSYITLYHYTDERGMKGIRDSREIRQSDTVGPDAVFGRGVYLTSLDPEEHSKKTIAQNNWDDYGRIWVKRGKVDYAIQVTVRKSEVKEANTSRDVYIYPGDLDIDDYDGEIIEVK